MNVFFTILGYVVIISQIFSIKMPIFSNLIFNYSIKFILFYFFIFISILRWIYIIFRTNRIKERDIFLIFFLVFPYIIGIIRGWGIQNILEESVLFVMPIAVYAWSQNENLSKEVYINIYLGTVIIGAIVSVLVALRIVETDIWAASNQLVRAAGAIDSTLFLGGFVISHIMLFVISNNDYKINKILCVSAYISSIIGLLFTQSRSRIFIAIMLIIGFMVFNLINKKSHFGNLRLIVLVSVCVIIVLLYTPDLFHQILTQVLDRFSTLSDGNIVYRENESSMQIQAFLSAPLTGLGWGSRSQFHNMYVHNIYTTLLMQCGIIFTLCFFVWILFIIIKNLKKIKMQGFNCENTICMSILAVLFILGFTNAGIVLSGGYFMLLYVFICNKCDVHLNRK